jgi:ribosome biogenesis GTPase
MEIKKQGQVTKSTGSWYRVKAGTDFYDCRVRGKLRLNKNVKATNPVAVGDIVDFMVEDQSTEGVISALAERKNYIIRKSTNLSKQAHIIAANVDMAILVVTIDFPKTEIVFIDRFLAAAEAYSIPVLIAINKFDLYQKEHLETLEFYELMYNSIGYKTMACSVKTGKGIEELRQLMKGKVNVMAGNSGVGKSSLISALDPQLSLKIGQISEATKSGKHTTTFAEMFDTDFGAQLIDTPGIRAFGLYDFDDETVDHYFREIFKYSEHCRFGNCTHTHEPGCAVIEALDAGKISPTRYNSYLNILSGDEGKYREDQYK